MAAEGMLATHVPSTVMPPTIQSSYSQAPLILLQVLSQLHALDLAYTAVRKKCEAAAERMEEERKRRSRDRARCDEREEELMNQLDAQKTLLLAATKDQEWSQQLLAELESRFKESEKTWQEKLELCEETQQNATKQIQATEKVQEELSRCSKREGDLMRELLSLKTLLLAATKDQQWSQQLLAELETRFKASQQTWQAKLDTCEETQQNAAKKIQTLQEEQQKITNQFKECNNQLQGMSQCTSEKQALLADKKDMVEALRLFDGRVRNEMLLKAARNGNAAAVRGLVSTGADIDVKDTSDNYKRSPLHWGATEGHVEVMKSLIALGADPRYDVNSDVYTLLHSAARYGKPNAVRYLLDGKWIPIDAIAPGRQETALHLASRYGHTEVINMLLAAGAKIDARNFKGSTPLHMAAWNGRKPAVITLVNHGASLTVSDGDGNAYENARSQGHYDIAQFIKSKM